jgi:phosphate uptake regulator
MSNSPFACPSSRVNRFRSLLSSDLASVHQSQSLAPVPVTLPTASDRPSTKPGEFPLMRRLEQELERLQHDVLCMAVAVEEAILAAVQALQRRDPALAEDVVAGDDQIDRDENQVDEECLKILALHQPVAIDLRRVTAVMHISTDLERMADLAEEMAERAVALAGLPPLPPPS